MSRIPSLIIVIIGISLVVIGIKNPEYMLPGIVSGIVISGQTLFSYLNISELMYNKKYISVIMNFIPIIIGAILTMYFSKNFAIFITGIIIEALGPVILSRILLELPNKK